MKKSAYTITAVLVLVVVAGLSNANAQTATQMSADIPFAFHVGDQSFEAGEYTVRCANPSSDRKVLQLRSKDGATIMIQTNSLTGNRDGEAKLVFNRYGDRYYFSEAWMADTIGMKVSKSRGERAVIKELASINRAVALVSLNRSR